MVETLSPEVLAAYRAMGMRPDGIADLDHLGLTPEQKAARLETLNCSEGPILWKGKPDWQADPAEVINLARVKWGEIEPDNLNDVLNVQAGQWMEPFILAWAERQLGVRISARGEKRFSARRPWLACTLDGLIEDYHGRGKWVVQTKFFSPFYRVENAIEDKRAQVLGEMYCAGADGTLLLIYNQGSKLEAWEFEPDPVPLSDLLEVCDDFWAAVKEKRLPAVLPPKPGRATPVRAIQVGELDMSKAKEANQWADAAADFLANREANVKFVASQDTLKKLTPTDKERAFGFGVEVTVTKAGAKSVKAIKAPEAPEAAAADKKDAA